MKKLLLFLSLLVIASGAGAQVRRSPIHLSFIPPLSTHGTNGFEYSNGGSFSFLVGISHTEENFSLAGLATVAKGELNGFNMAGLLNYAGDSGRGFMISGLGNMVVNHYRGFQFAGLFNKAGEISGFQMAGLVNVAKNVRGVQLSGLLNVAENSDYPIALINIIRNGEYGISVGYNDIGSVMASFRSGGRVTYGILGMGYNHKSKDKGYVTEGGFGAHIQITSWLRINNEIKGGSIGNFSENSVFYSNYAFMPAFRITRHIEIFVGPAINYMNTDDLKNANLFPKRSIWKKYKPSGMQQLYVGYQAGIQIIL